MQSSLIYETQKKVCDVLSNDPYVLCKRSQSLDTLGGYPGDMLRKICAEIILHCFCTDLRCYLF